VTATYWELLPCIANSKKFLFFRYLNIKSAIQFHIETFGDEAFEMDEPILEAFVAETGVSVNA